MLFSRSAIRVEKEEHEDLQPGAARASGTARHVRGIKRAGLQELIGTLQQNEHVHIPSMGSWSMHDMLAFILEQTGPADVWFTSWTITEGPMRLVVDLLERGVIRSCRALLSERVEAMNPAALQLAKGNLQLRLLKLHAKSIVVLNDSWGVTVGGSANFTRNPRIEKYIVCTHRDIAEAERTWIDQVFAGAEPFAHEP